MHINKNHSSDNVPQLRFPEFTGEWEKKKFGDVYTFKTTNSFSRDKLNYIEGSIKNIHYGDIHTKFSTLFDISNENVPYINPDVDIQRISTDNYCKEGDLVIADASEDLNDIGKSIELFTLNNEKVLAGLHTFIARPKEGSLAKGYGGYLMKSPKVRLQVQKEAQGTKVLGISTGRLSKVELPLPTLPEQQKIASFFTAIDQRLTHLKLKKTLLEDYKKGVMQKIFKQEIRFKDDNGKDYPDWERKRLKDVLFEHKTLNSGNKFTEVLSVAKQKGVINQIEHLGRSFAAKDISNYKVINPYDIVYTKSPTSDYPFGIIKQSQLNRSGVVSPLYGVFKPATPALGFMLHNYFLSWVNTYNYLKPLVEKGAKNTMNINNDTFLNGTKLSLPVSENEQTKIANFLSAIDKKIEGVAEAIEATEKWKKGLMQRMFV